MIDLILVFPDPLLPISNTCNIRDKQREAEIGEKGGGERGREGRREGGGEGVSVYIIKPSHYITFR